MIELILLLAAGSFLISLLLTGAMIRVATRLHFTDKPGGRKMHPHARPLGGGVALFVAIALPMLCGTIAIQFVSASAVDHFIHDRDAPALISGARQEVPLALGILGAMAVLHVTGLRDDRKAMGPYTKLLVQLGVSTALVICFKEMRALTTLGVVPSIVVTVLWIAAITNAFNFLDNMDGLSAGVACICAIAFFVTTLLIGQWFVAGMLALLIGALLGFLCWNFPPAKIFMGDSGSLLIGFVLGILTVRTTFLPVERQSDFAGGWYAVLAPVVVLALPLYDLVVVSIIRISRGKSPFVGDTNHFSHRLVARGMSRRTAVLCLYLVTAATSIAAVLLPQVRSTFAAIMIFAQTVLILCLVALLEQHPLPTPKADRL